MADSVRRSKALYNIADDLHSAAVKALELVESPYKLGGNNPDGFDQSGFVQYVFREVSNQNFPRTSNEQWRAGMNVNMADLKSGDVLFFQGNNVRLPGIYIDNNIFVIVTTNGVAAVDLETSDYWKPRLLGAKRFTTSIIEKTAVDNPIVKKTLRVFIMIVFFIPAVFKNTKKICLPRKTYDQCKVGKTVVYDNRRPGDVIYFSGKGQEGISHAAIYLGNNYIIQASGEEGMTTISYLGPAWLNRYAVVKRF